MFLSTLVLAGIVGGRVGFVCPLFLEFPHATRDETPIDLEAGGSEFLFGADVLIAPNPSLEKVAPYEVALPPEVCYDNWTGERLDRRT